MGDKNEELIKKINSKFKLVSESLFQKDKFVVWVLGALLCTVFLFFVYDFIMKLLIPTCTPKTKMVGGKLLRK